MLRAWHAAAAVLLLVVAGSGQAQSGAVTITTSSPLSFGSLTGAAGGSVTIAPDGTRSANGVFPVAGGFGAATFTVRISQGNPHYMITLPAAATLTSAGGATMTIDTFRSNPATQGMAQPPTRVDTMTVGATLRVGAGQKAGAYNGLFQVVVNL